MKTKTKVKKFFKKKFTTVKKSRVMKILFHETKSVVIWDIIRILPIIFILITTWQYTNSVDEMFEESYTNTMEIYGAYEHNTQMLISLYEVLQGCASINGTIQTISYDENEGMHIICNRGVEINYTEVSSLPIAIPEIYGIYKEV